QGGGGDTVIVSYTPFGGIPQVIPTNVLFVPDAALTALPNAVNVTGNATIQILGGAFSTLCLGALTASAGSTLNVAGQSGKKLTFTSTTVNGSGSFSVNDTADVALSTTGRVSGGSTLNLAKQGAGSLILDNTAAGASANSFAASSTLDVF